MTRSETPTGYLLIKAHTNSEWDGCDAAILSIDVDWLHKQQQRQSLLTVLEKDTEFYKADFFEYRIVFYNDYKLSEELLGDDMFCFIAATEDEIASLEKPQQDIETPSIQIGKGSGVDFKAWGKHGTDEFFTEEVDIVEVASMYGK